MAVKITTLRTVVGYLEKWAPRELAESWDNVGLLVEPPSGSDVIVKGVMLTNDLTEPVLNEALAVTSPGIQLILSYHPPIFKGLTRITTETWQGRIIGKCLSEGVAVYSPHTSWDNTDGGISDWLLTPFVEDENRRERLKESGRICHLSKPVPLNEIVQRYKDLTKQERVRLIPAFSANMNDIKCQSVGVCAGSGSGVLVGTAGACDLWVTGEMSHHELLNAQQSGTNVILLEHSNSERGFLRHFKSKLSNEFPDLNIAISNADNDPVTIV